MKTSADLKHPYQALVKQWVWEGREILGKKLSCMEEGGITHMYTHTATHCGVRA